MCFHEETDPKMGAILTKIYALRGQFLLGEGILWN